MSCYSYPARKKARTPVYGRSFRGGFVDDSELREALRTVTPQGIATNDWILPVPDPEAQDQTVEGELARLRTLQSYFLLHAGHDGHARRSRLLCRTRRMFQGDPP